MWETIMQSVEVRRYNGQCEYGQWMPLAEMESDGLEAAISNQVMYDDLDEGEVQVGAAAFRWRKVSD